MNKLPIEAGTITYQYFQSESVVHDVRWVNSVGVFFRELIGVPNTLKTKRANERANNAPKGLAHLGKRDKKRWTEIPLKKASNQQKKK